MHDPCVVAFQIKYPWRQCKPWPKKYRHARDRNHAWKRMSEEEKQGCDSFWPEGYRETFITIWHVDPEKGGSDDSCGWSYPRIPDIQKRILWNIAWSEGQHSHFLCCPEKRWDRLNCECESLYRGLLVLINSVLHLGFSFDRLALLASRAIHSPDVSHPGDMFCFIPGYHTNQQKDSSDDRREHFYGILCGVTRTLLHEKRRWWQHPRWHFWHWKFQVHPLVDFKRWLFSRCAGCGQRFAYGESPVSCQWDSPGPRWFRGERGVYHGNCTPNLKPSDESKNS